MIGRGDLENEALLLPGGWGAFHSVDALVSEIECWAMLHHVDALLRRKGANDDAEPEEENHEHGSPWLRPYEGDLTAIFLQDYWDRMSEALKTFKAEIGYNPPHMERAYNALEKAIDEMRIIDPDTKKEVKARIAEIMKAGFDRADGDEDDYLSSHGKLLVQDGLWTSLEYYLREFFYRFVAPKVEDELDAVYDHESETKEPDEKKILGFLNSPSYVTAYMAILANVAAQRAFNYGYLMGAQSRGMRAFKFVAVMDDRTTQICRSLNGRVFWVADALRLLERAYPPSDPTASKTVTPWVRAETIDGMTAQQLRDAGVMVPPLHPCCRSHLEEVLTGYP